MHWLTDVFLVHSFNNALFRMNPKLFATVFMLLVGEAASQLCGGQAYDPAADLCCTNVIHAGKLTAGELCCGDKSFDPR